MAVAGGSAQMDGVRRFSMTGVGDEQGFKVWRQVFLFDEKHGSRKILAMALEGTKSVLKVEIQALAVLLTPIPRRCFRER